MPIIKIKTNAFNLLRCQICKRKHPQNDFFLCQKHTDKKICDYCFQHAFPSTPPEILVKQNYTLCKYCGEKVSHIAGKGNIKGVRVVGLCKNCRAMLRRVL